jgi:hypothetical protein
MHDFPGCSDSPESFTEQIRSSRAVGQRDVGTPERAQSIVIGQECLGYAHGSGGGGLEPRPDLIAS